MLFPVKFFTGVTKPLKTIANIFFYLCFFSYVCFWLTFSYILPKYYLNNLTGR